MLSMVELKMNWKEENKSGENPARTAEHIPDSVPNCFCLRRMIVGTITAEEEADSAKLIEKMNK